MINEKGEVMWIAKDYAHLLRKEILKPHIRDITIQRRSIVRSLRDDLRPYTHTCPGANTIESP